MDRSSESYWERFENLVAQFYPPLSATDGIPLDLVASSESRLRIELPRRLVEFYARCGKRDDLVSSYERLLQPDSLRLTDGTLVFVEENQGVSQWGMQPANDDPPVRRKDCTENPSWEPDHDRLSDFLITFVRACRSHCGSPGARS
jgi:hypothetical protein